MIPAVSPLLNLLAPKAAATAGSDPAAFQLALAGVGEAVAVGRQAVAPGGNSMPLLAEIVPELPDAQLLPTSDPLAEVRPPVASVPAIAPTAPRPQSPVATRRPAAWLPFVQPESCASPLPVSDLPMPAGDREEADVHSPAPPRSPVQSTETAPFRPLPGREVAEPEPEQVAGPDRVHAREMATRVALGGPPIHAMRGVIGKPAAARPVDDEPSPTLDRSPEPARPIASAAIEAQTTSTPQALMPLVPDAEAPSRAAEIAIRATPIASEAPIRPFRSLANEQGVERPVVVESGAAIPTAATRDVVPDPASADLPSRAVAPAFLATGPLPSSDRFSADQLPSAASQPSEASPPRSIPPVGIPSTPSFLHAGQPTRTLPRLPEIMTTAPKSSSIEASPGSTDVAPPVVSTTPVPSTYPVDVAPPVPRQVAPEPASSAPPAPARSYDGGAGTTVAPVVPVASAAVPAAVAPLLSAAPPVEQATDAVVTPSDPRPDSAKPTPAERASAAPMPVASSMPTLARTVMSGSAGQVFAADLRRTARDTRTIPGEALAPPLEIARPDAATAPAAAPLDLRQDRWPSAMVERIERLRDAVDAVDTRIRLIPDALGAIDVAVKRDGDTVHVHFTAEQAATRALLQDAAPRLAEAAEARGLKLGQTAVGDGGSQPNGRQPQSQADPAPVPARPRSASADEDATDTRIA